MDQLTIVSKKYLEGLQKRAAMFWLGWLAFIIALIILLGTINDLSNEIKVLHLVQKRQVELEFDQEKTRLSLIRAWESHQQEVRTVEAWGEYIKTRDDLSRYNSTVEKLPALTANIGAKHGSQR